MSIPCAALIESPLPPHAQAFAYSTVSVRFWPGASPADTALYAPNSKPAGAPTGWTAPNCGVDTSALCNGPLLYVNFPGSLLSTFMEQFSGGPLLFSYPARGQAGFTAVKTISSAATGLSASSDINSVNANAALIQAVCNACIAALV